MKASVRYKDICRKVRNKNNSIQDVTHPCSQVHILNIYIESSLIAVSITGNTYTPSLEETVQIPVSTANECNETNQDATEKVTISYTNQIQSTDDDTIQDKQTDLEPILITQDDTDLPTDRNIYIDNHDSYKLPFVVTQDESDDSDEENDRDLSDIYNTILQQKLSGKTADSDLPAGVSFNTNSTRKTWYFDEEHKQNLRSEKKFQLYFAIRALDGKLNHDEIWKKVHTKPTSETFNEFNTYQSVTKMKLLKPITMSQNEALTSMQHMNIMGTEVVRRINNDTVLWQSLKTLDNGMWLNDEIINYFFCLMNEHSVGVNNKCHFVSTSFYTKLMEGNTYNYNNIKSWVRRWTAGSIFSQHHIYIPVNINNQHWVLVVINFQHKKIQYYDSSSYPGQTYANNILRFVLDEATNEPNRVTRNIQMSGWTIDINTDVLPKQHNNYDCGIYICMYSYFHYFDLPMTFGASNATEFRLQMKRCILSGHKL